MCCLLKFFAELSCFRDGSVEAGQLGPLSVNQATPPPPPGIPYNSVAAGRIAASSSATNTSASATSPANVVNAKTTVIATYAGKTCCFFSSNR